jgi:hypothetical protein
VKRLKNAHCELDSGFGFTDDDLFGWYLSASRANLDFVMRCTDLSAMSK